MKKFLSCVLAVLMLLGLCACAAEAPAADPTQAPEATDAPAPTATPEPAPSIESALVLLETVWAGYADEDKFPCGGGDADNMAMDAPGKFGVTDTEALDATLGLPADQAANIDDAASFMHMMNANTFTSGCFRLKDDTDAAAFTAALESHIMERQWMCGFPETLVIYTVENYVVSAFGNGELIDAFQGYLTAAYDTAAVVCDKPIA